MHRGPAKNPSVAKVGAAGRIPGVVLVLVILLAGPATAGSWTSLFEVAEASPPGALTLEEARREALERSPRLRQYASRLREAGFRVDEARSAGLPHLDLRAGYTRLTPTLDFVTPGGALPIVRTDNWEAGLHLRQALLTFGRLEGETAAAELGVEVAREEHRREVELLLAEVSQTFLELAWRQDEVGVAADRLEARRAHLEDVERLYEAGTVADYDRLASRADEAEADQRLLTARHRVELVRARLATLLGRSLEEPLEISLEGLAETPVEDRQAGLARAEVRRPELAALRQAVEAARARVRAAAGQGAPRLDLETGYLRRTGTAFQTDQQWAAGVALSIPLFDGGATAARTAQAEEVVRQMEEALEATRRRVDLEVQEAWLDLDEARGRIAMARQRLDRATEAERVARMRYQVGVSTNLELLEAQATLAEARAGWSEAGFRVRSAWVRWERATSGEFLTAGRGGDS